MSSKVSPGTDISANCPPEISNSGNPTDTPGPESPVAAAANANITLEPMSAHGVLAQEDVTPAAEQETTAVATGQQTMEPTADSENIDMKAESENNAPMADSDVSEPAAEVQGIVAEVQDIAPEAEADITEPLVEDSGLSKDIQDKSMTLPVVDDALKDGETLMDVTPEEHDVSV